MDCRGRFKTSYVHDYDDSELQRRLDKAVPWVGLYITVASAVCMLAMAADVVHGLRHKMLWFPCKYFSLNAASLTVLAVAMKLPTDLSTQMIKSADWIARHISLLFMITAMSNFMPSLGCKSDGAILANIFALGILVVTILANSWVQTIQLADFLQRQDINADVAITVLMLFLLVTTISSAITIPVSKRNLESKYQEIHGVPSRRQEAVTRRDGIRIDKRTIYDMKKYWIAVETGNPQFVAARLIFCITSGLVCLLSTIILLIIYIKWYLREHRVTLGTTDTAYGRYTQWILVLQTIGAVVGMIAPIFRWFVAVRFKHSETIDNINFKKEFRIEPHWIQTLVHWRDSFSVLQYSNLWCQKYLYDAKWFFLSFCIRVQVLVVLLSKVFLFGSAFLSRPFFLFSDLLEKCCSKRLFTDSSSSEHHQGLESDTLNLHKYVLLLEGEAMLPRRTLMNICHKADELIQKGKTQRPRNLIHLLTKIRNFNGVGEFDSSRVPSLHSQEPPNCWTLPLVTFTSIVVALPNVSDHKIKQLVSCLNEGMSLTKIVDKTSDSNAQLKNIRRAAKVCWGRVVLYRKWQGFDLRKLSTKYKNSKEVLQELSQIAKKTMKECNRDAKDLTMENPLSWPVNIIVANSMYRISQTILLSYQDQEDEPTDEELFDQLSTRIAGILAACLTNLATVIITLCHCNAIGKREKSVRKAFLLLGKTGEILELLQEYEWPSLAHRTAASIDEWYALIHPNNDVDEVKTAAVFNAEQTSIEIH